MSSGLIKLMAISGSVKLDVKIGGCRLSKQVHFEKRENRSPHLSILTFCDHMRPLVVGDVRTVKTKILLIAESGLARTAYTEALCDLNVEVDCIASPDEITDVLVDEAYSGLLVDVPTMIRCECENKNRITRIMDRFPVLRLMYNPKFGGIRGLAHGGTVRDNRDLGDFIIHECVPFEPRSIRVAQRHDVVFNVMLLNEIDRQDVEAERTVTVNVSEHGCFVYTVSDWRLHSPAWLVVNEFDDKTPIELKIRWHGKWGAMMSMPGIGASFESMTTHQYVQLHSFL